MGWAIIYTALLLLEVEQFRKSEVRVELVALNACKIPFWKPTKGKSRRRKKSIVCYSIFV